jgi:hypothetical protein
MINNNGNSGKNLLFSINILLGLYFINYHMNWVEIINNSWIVFIGGVFLILAGLKQFSNYRHNRYGYPTHY